MVEEFTEYLEAEHSGNLVEIADALIDLEYVTLGTHLEYGLPQPKLFKEVHNANMAKLDVAGEPIKDEGGKILKPEGPNIKRIIGHD
jgi:predicted HAD superfamily Cof-like phosphohydrolase